MPNYPSDEEIDDLAEKISDILVSKRTGTFVLSIIMSGIYTGAVDYVDSFNILSWSICYV